MRKTASDDSEVGDKVLRENVLQEQQKGGKIEDNGPESYRYRHILVQSEEGS